MTAKRFKLDDFDSEVEMWELMNTQAEVISDLEKENEQLKYSLSAYMVDLNNYKGRCSALEQENESLKEENKFLRNKIKTYKSGNALLKKTLDKEWK